jgi:hypothetical protein
MHAGHKSKVSDISWNLNDKLVMASVEDDNIVQVWQMVNYYKIFLCNEVGNIFKIYIFLNNMKILGKNKLVFLLI